jgi:hypothetical protein
MVLPLPQEFQRVAVVLVVVVTHESTHPLETLVVLVSLVRQDKVSMVEPHLTVTVVVLVVVVILRLENLTQVLEVETQVKVWPHQLAEHLDIIHVVVLVLVDLVEITLDRLQLGVLL